jgi:hypothetical protein
MADHLGAWPPTNPSQVTVKHEPSPTQPSTFHMLSRFFIAALPPASGDRRELIPKAQDLTDSWGLEPPPEARQHVKAA